MADDELPPPDVTPVRLLDRLKGAPAFEKHFNGVPLMKKAGKDELILPRHVAIWLLQHDRDKVWAKDQGFVHRFALVDHEDTEVIARCGRDVLDHDPIELDPAMQEGWDVTKSSLPRREIAYTNLSGRDLADARRLLNERMAGAAAFVKG